MRRPPPTVTVGVRVPFQGINVSANYEKSLIIAAGAVRHYKLVVHDMKLSMTKWMVLKELDLYLTALED